MPAWMRTLLYSCIVTCAHAKPLRTTTSSSTLLSTTSTYNSPNVSSLVNVDNTNITNLEPDAAIPWSNETAWHWDVIVAQLVKEYANQNIYTVNKYNGTAVQFGELVGASLWPSPGLPGPYTGSLVCFEAHFPGSILNDIACAHFTPYQNGSFSILEIKENEISLFAEPVPWPPKVSENMAAHHIGSIGDKWMLQHIMYYSAKSLFEWDTKGPVWEYQFYQGWASSRLTRVYMNGSTETEIDVWNNTTPATS